MMGANLSKDHWNGFFLTCVPPGHSVDGLRDELKDEIKVDIVFLQEQEKCYRTNTSSCISKSVLCTLSQFIISQ